MAPAVRIPLDEATKLGRIERRALDAILANLDPEQFEAQLEIVIEAVGVLPLAAPPMSAPSDHGPDLPFASRVSRRYLHDIHRFPPMSREDEVAAAKRLEFAAERVEAAAFRPAPVRAARLLEHQALLNEFVERNLASVVSEVYAYRTYDVPLDDLVQEGNAALIHAVEKFDWRKGVRFRTYLAWWIRQAVERHLAAQKGAVRVPHHLQQKLRRLKREGTLPRGFDGPLAMADVARAFDVDAEHAGHLVEASRASISLEQAFEERGDRGREELSESPEIVDHDRDAALRNRIGGLLDELDDRERTVVRLRFGLDGRAARTLEEIGTVLHLSRERSRQIQQSALGKLRARALRTRLHDEL